MTVPYFVRPSADKEIDDIADDLSERGGLDVGLRFLSSVYETFALVSTQSEMGWPCRLNHPDLETARVYRIVAPFEKYLFFYIARGSRIEVVRVLHGAQDLEQRLADEGFS